MAPGSQNLTESKQRHLQQLVLPDVMIPVDPAGRFYSVHSMSRVVSVASDCKSFPCLSSHPNLLSCTYVNLIYSELILATIRLASM